MRIKAICKNHEHVPVVMLSGTTTYYSNDVEQVTDEDEEDAMIVQLDEASLHCFWKEGPHDLVFEVIEECSYDENGDYKH